MTISPDHTESRASSEPEPTTASGTESESQATEGQGHWLTRTLTEHTAHTAVIAFLIAYPGIYTVLLNAPFGPEMEAILPEIETMLAVLYFGLFAMSFDFISGYTGYLSFGHAAFYGTGAYFVVLAVNGKLPFVASGTPFMVLLLLAGLAAVVVALLIGSVSFRLSGVYFAMITLGFAQVLYVFMRGWDYLGSNPRDGVIVASDVEAFQIGVPGIDSLGIGIGPLVGDEIAGLLGFIDLSTAEVSYYAIGCVVLLCYFAMQRMIHSPFGRVMIAIRENEERARAIGYNTFRYKLSAFAISGFFAGIAGALFAGYQRTVTPDDSLFFLVTGDALLSSIIGGFGTLAGPLFGRAFDETVREFLSKSGAGGGLLPYLRDLLPPSVMDAEIGGVTVSWIIETFLNGHASLYLGVLFVLFVLYVPHGLLGTVRARLGSTVAQWSSEWIDRKLGR